jgi:putative phosphoribosyl transferase
MRSPDWTETIADHLPEPVLVAAAGVSLPGILTLPPHPTGVVAFAHGSGSSRFSARNRLVADALVEANFGTLLFDLLTEREADNRTNVFDIPLLAGRLRGAGEWLAAYQATADLPLGYFGASTGAAAALVAAAEMGSAVRAVVSRGGRPDLAADSLPQVRTPTLLIVGEADSAVLALNQTALRRLGGIRQLAVVPLATHLFEEPGALEKVAGLAAFWFGRYLGAGGSRERGEKVA